jgi:hypothetical protein
MRLTKELKSRLKGLILKEKFNERLEVMRAREAVIADMFYNLRYSPEVQAKMNALPEGWLNETSNESVRIYYSPRHIHEIVVWRKNASSSSWSNAMADPLTAPEHEYTDSERWDGYYFSHTEQRRETEADRTATKIVRMEELTQEQQETITKYLVDRSKLSTETNHLSRKITDVLDHISSTKKLLELLPEAEKYLAQLKPSCSDIPTSDAAAQLRKEI